MGFFIFVNKDENLSLNCTFFIALAINIPAKTSQKAEDAKPEKIISSVLKENIKDVNKKISEVW